MTKQIDFTHCKIVLGHAYNGANGKKVAVEYEGQQYMLKFPPSGENKHTELSYTNSCISEHLGSSIFNLLGVQAQETMLGTFEVSGKTKVVCACKDFTADGRRLLDFCSIKNTILDSDSNGSGTELVDILETIEKQQYIPPKDLLAHFWDVFVVDALLGNFDRHNGNWGFLVAPDSGIISLAPIYDCGSCLLPQADESVMQEVLTNQDALAARVYQFPTSSIKQGGKKLNYYDFLTTTDNKDCREAVKRIVPRVNMEQIRTLITETPYLSDLQKEFYKHYLIARFDRILQPALEISMEQKDFPMTQTFS